MNYLTSEKFSFQSKAVDEKTFGVVKFTGSEGLSQLYHFDIMLVADSYKINIGDILQANAVFYIHRDANLMTNYSRSGRKMDACFLL